MRKAVAIALVSALLFSAVAATKFINSATAQNHTDIIIKADGSVDPLTSPIQRVGDVYALVGDVDSTEVQRNNIVLDGNGHALSGTVTLTNVRNITAKNMSIKDSTIGIMLDGSSNVTISDNTIRGTRAYSPFGQATAAIYIWEGNSNTVAGNYLANNTYGIVIGEKSEHNIIVGNNITDSTAEGIRLYTSSNNHIYHNNFKNAINVYDSSGDFDESPSVNIWDNGTDGNYWSDYNGTDFNGDGIGDTPYVIDADNIDHYPLMSPYITLLPEPKPQPFPTILVIAVFVTVIVVLAAGLLVYFKKRKH